MNSMGLPNIANCADLMIPAERELAAFLSAVTELYGTEQAEMAADVWLDELEMINRLPGPAIHDWRKVSVASVARLANHLAAAQVSSVPSSDISSAVLSGNHSRQFS